MQNHDHITNELIGLIYETAKEPNIWPILLGGLSSIADENEQISLITQQTDYEADNVYQLAVGSNALVLNARDLSQDKTLTDELSQSLIPHFQRALEINKQLSEAMTERNSAASVLERLPLGVIVVDKNGTIVSMNDQAQGILDLKNGLLIKNNIIHTNNADETLELQKLIKTATQQNDEQLTSQTFSLKHHPLHANISILITPTKPSTPSRLNENLCSLLIATSESQQAISQDLLIKIYALSPAEARVTQLLVKGFSLKEITDKLCISQHTTKTQLKSIFQKTDTHRQSELIGKLLSDPAILLNQNQYTPTATNNEDDLYRFHPKQQRESHLQLKDGRNLCYAEYGDPNGKPLFFFHSMIACRQQSPPNPEKLIEMGIRLIVPDRPGYGKSSHKVERSLLDWADDFGQLLAHLEIDKFYLIGYSAGGPHAAACAFRFPNRCLRLGLISSMWPFETLNDLDGMKSAVKMILGLARYTPSLLIPFLHIMAKSVLKDPVDYLKRVTTDWSACDLALIENKNLMKEMTDCFKEVIRNGTEGLFHEHFLVARQWGFKLKDIKTETITWHGEDDNIIPLSYVQRFSQIPNSRLVQYPNAGHIMIVDYWQEMFEVTVK